MKRTPEEVKAILSHIPAGELDYNDWLHVGMALKNEGYSFDLWDGWSVDDENTDQRPSKWESFKSSGCEMGTIVMLARRFNCPESVLFPRLGEQPNKKTAGSAAGSDFKDCANLPTLEQSRLFLSAIYREGELICYESSKVQKEDDTNKYKPCDSSLRRIETREQLLQRLEQCSINNYYMPAGMWILANPVKAERTSKSGRAGKDVAAWRHVLIESDDMSQDQQISWLLNSELPITSISTSGSRSVHALVRLDAPDLEEYKRRSRLIYDWCDAHGFQIDKATKDPSRLTRFPGFPRGSEMQQLLCICEHPEKYEDWEKRTTKKDTGASTADKFECKEIPWLIYGLIPARNITLFGAEGGTGKSSLTCDLMASIIRGTKSAVEYRYGSLARKPQRVLFFSSEDPFESITLPRLKALGCTPEDLKRLYVVPNSDELFPRIKFDSQELFTLIDKTEPALIVFDPLQAFLNDGLDMSRRNQMRNTLQALLAHIGEREIAVLIVCHCNKSFQLTGVNRIADSKDITDFSRSVFLMGYTHDEDENGQKIRYLSHEKSNYAPPRDTVLYTIESGNTPIGPMGFFNPIGITDKKDFDFRTEDTKKAKESKREELKTAILEELQEGAKKREQLLKLGSYATVSRALSDLVKDNQIRALLPEGKRGGASYMLSRANKEPDTLTDAESV